MNAFIIFTIFIISIELVGILISKIKNYAGAGFIIGSTAGTFMALQTATKRITAIPAPTLIIAFTFISFAVTTLTFIFTQFAFTKANANIVIPCFTSTSIIFAILIGIIALNEQITFWQIIGIIAIIIGIVLLIGFTKEVQEKKK